MRIRCEVLLLSLALALLLVGAVNAPAKEEDAARVRFLKIKWSASYKKGKIDTLASLLSDAFAKPVEDANPYSKSGYIPHTADTSIQVKVAELSDLKVHLH